MSDGRQVQWKHQAHDDVPALPEWTGWARKVVSTMIPCQQTCSDYCEGCHKNCARWAEFQRQKCRERQAKKDYLKYYNELCGAVVRQLSAMGAVR